MNKRLINAGILMCCVLFAATVSAEGKDVLAAMIPDVKTTTEGTGKSILYVLAFFASAAAYIVTKNITVFSIVLVVMIMFNFMIVTAF